jgi:hypothetical protein
MQFSKAYLFQRRGRLDIAEHSEGQLWRVYQLLRAVTDGLLQGTETAALVLE